MESKQGYVEVGVHSVALALWWEAAGFAKLPPHPDHTGKGYTPRIPDAVLYTNDRACYAAFLRGLANKHDSAAPSILVLRHQPRSADERRHVDVMAAGVHHADLGAGIVGRANRARVGNAGFLAHRQRIEVGAHQDNATGAVAQHCDEPIAADAGGHFGSELFELGGDAGGGLFLVIG